ncbi:MAG: DUF481 domain-containing protein [Kiritimatiellae bacterium]|nr:DUF481 domain-containing protein [Kiritimatiellia bacterium]
MKAVLSILALLLVTQIANARDTEGFETDLNLGLNLTRGNRETSTLTIGAQTKRIQAPHEFTAEVKYNYGRSTLRPDDGTKRTDTTQDVIEGETQYNYLFSENTYALVVFSALKDEIAKIDYRLIGGPGIGHYFVRNDVWLLSVEIGISYLTENQDGDKDDYITGRLAQKYERNLSENALVWQNLEYLPELEDFENYLLEVEIGARAQLNGNLSLRVVLQSRYDNTPAQGKKHNDLTLLAGIGYRL